MRVLNSSKSKSPLPSASASLKLFVATHAWVAYRAASRWTSNISNMAPLYNSDFSPKPNLAMKPTSVVASPNRTIPDVNCMRMKR